MGELTSFERTQIWKEYQHPIIIRQSGLKAAQEYASMHDLELSLPELMALTKHFINYFENGDETWITKANEYLTKKKIMS